MGNCCGLFPSDGFQEHPNQSQQQTPDRVNLQKSAIFSLLFNFKGLKNF